MIRHLLPRLPHRGGAAVRAAAVAVAGAASAGAVVLGAGAAGTASVADAEKAKTKGRPVRVLVTGFNDWKELGKPANLWRCRDNPSCRLLLGATSATPPPVRAGEMAALLRREKPAVELIAGCTAIQAPPSIFHSWLSTQNILSGV
jgi:hypothetical protein